MIAVIPARAGSKRIPGKNMRLFHGKPLVQWAVEAALASRVFDAVAVSSEHISTLDFAVRLGAVPWVRDPAWADDDTTLVDLMAHLAADKDVAPGQDLTLVYCNPFTRPGDLARAMDVFDMGWKPYVTAMVRPQAHLPFIDAGQFSLGLRSAWARRLDEYAYGVPYEIAGPNVDINTPEDWALAERLFAARSSQVSQDPVP